MNILFFDTETDGLVKFDKPWNHPEQPNLVQLGFVMTNHRGEEVNSACLIVEPNGWTIPPHVSKIHGITNETASESGLSKDCVSELFLQAAFKADLLVAFNFKFDSVVMAKATNTPLDSEKSFCPMLALTDVCKLPGKRGYKWPKLSEAYRFFFGRDFEGAHNALSDSRATKEIFFEMINRSLIKLDEAVHEAYDGCLTSAK